MSRVEFSLEETAAVLRQTMPCHLFFPARCGRISSMSEPDEKPPRYRWPWFALAAVVLFIVLAVIWVTLAAEKVERQRDYSAPISSGTPGH
jgi:hypothetical protein